METGSAMVAAKAMAAVICNASSSNGQKSDGNFLDSDSGTATDDRGKRQQRQWGNSDK